MINAFRREIDACLERPLSHKEYSLLDTDGSIRSIQRGELDPAGVAAKVRQWREAFGATAPPPFPSVPKLRANPARDARAELLSYVITLMAERLEEVAAFRREVLGEKLLTTQGVELWIKSRSEAEGFSVWLEVPYSSSSGRLQRDQEGGLYVEPPLTISKSHPATDVEWRWLAYSPPATVERRVKTAANGALERLRILSANVAREVGCEAGEAAVFILSGQPLPFYPCRQTVDFVSADQLSALNRIELCIDPALSPREVSIIYRQMRGKIFGRRRHRNMSEKHIRLALFTMARGASEPLKRAIEAWNKLHPKWRYRQESNFGRDRIVALRRVVDALDSSPASKSNVEKWLTKLEPDHAQGSKTHQRRQRK